MINITVGKPGMGKTYSLVRRAFKFHKQGRDIYSNFALDFSVYYPSGLKPKNYGKIYFWTDIAQLISVRDGEILMDEAQIYLNSREWKYLPKAMMYKLQQHRKQGLNIWGAVQNVKRIDTVCRELVNTIYQVRCVGRFFVMNEYDIEDIDKVGRKSYSTRVFVLRKKLANCYNTMQEISDTLSFSPRGQ